MNTATALQPVYIIDGARTPFLKARGTPGPFTPVDLAVWAGRPLLLRQPFAADAFDEVILGCVNPHYDEVNPGRVAAQRLGCGDATPGWTVQRNCGSGMQSVECGFRRIASGQARLILAGGTEALSHAPLVLRPEAAAWLGEWNQAASATTRAALLTRLRPDFVRPILGLLRGLTDPVCGLNMGQTAEVLAYRFGISRADADAYALESHRRLAAAQNENRVAGLTPIYDRDGKLYDRDDGVRADSTLEALAALRPVFEHPFGEVTAGNSSQVTDGACWLVLASEEAVERHGLQPLARIVDSRWDALDPAVMGIAPVFSVARLMRQHALDFADLGAIELNEAFAVQVLACLAAWQDDAFCRRHLGLDAALGTVDRARLNVDGGAISLGHPVGTSGTRILLNLVHALRRLGARRGIGTECIGGGQAGAMLVEAL